MKGITTFLLSGFGWLVEVYAASNNNTLLDFSCATSKSVFSANETWGSLVASANLSSTKGKPFVDTVYVQSPGYLDLNMTYNQSLPFTDLILDVTIRETGIRVVSGRNVSFDNLTEFLFPLESLQTGSYKLDCYAASIDGQQVWEDSTEFSLVGESFQKRERKDERGRFVKQPITAGNQNLELRDQIDGIDVWCGKPYRAGSPMIPVDGQFSVPTVGSTPLLHLGCKPRIQPYLEEDTGSMLISTEVSYDVGVPFDISANTVSITVKTTNGSTIMSKTLGLNETHDLSFDLSDFFTPQSSSYNISCTASTPNTTGSNITSITSPLYYLPPNPSNGSTTKIDRLTGALLVQNSTTNAYEPLFGTGFYAGFSWWLSLDVVSIMTSLKSQGYNIIHPVGTNTNDTAMDLIARTAEDLGMWVIPGLSTDADMSATGNNSYLTSQIEKLQQYKSILFWYTWDEPDGQVDKINATTLSTTAIREVDALYHPIGIVLNCENYFWKEYSEGADIISADVYPIAQNASFSTQYGTVCTDTYGDCGCDNCEGRFEDISDRLDTFRARQRWAGYEDKVLWSVPQAFGSETFWARYPTEEEIEVEYAISVVHGAKGLEAWDAPSTPTILASAGKMATRFTAVKGFLFGSRIGVEVAGAERVDAGAWMEKEPLTGVQDTDSVLVVVVNMNMVKMQAKVELEGKTAGSAEDMFDAREVTVEDGAVSLELEGLGVAFLMIALQ